MSKKITFLVTLTLITLISVLLLGCIEVQSISTTGQEIHAAGEDRVNIHMGR